MDAAWDPFMQRGFDGVTVSAIEERSSLAILDDQHVATLDAVALGELRCPTCLGLLPDEHRRKVGCERQRSRHRNSAELEPSQHLGSGGTSSAATAAIERRRSGSDSNKYLSK